jgi:hypothetical protein
VPRQGVQQLQQRELLHPQAREHGIDGRLDLLFAVVPHVMSAPTR